MANLVEPRRYYPPSISETIPSPEVNVDERSSYSDAFEQYEQVADSHTSDNDSKCETNIREFCKECVQHQLELQKAVHKIQSLEKKVQSQKETINKERKKSRALLADIEKLRKNQSKLDSIQVC